MNVQEYEYWIGKMMNMSPSFQQVGRVGYHPGMETIKAFDDFLGHPHRQFRSIHVAGTNGKGSVSHLLASVCSAHGCKTGLYTSPHLADFRERIRIDGEMITRQEVVDFFRRSREFIEQHHPSFFEITTAMAWDHFARHGVDVALIEVGLGGRLDSTNLITPVLSVITSIGYDHCDLLGHTLPEIAKEKGGIIKSGVPVVLGSIQPELVPVFEELASHVQAPLFCSSQGQWEQIPQLLAEMDLKGAYQAANLKTVFTALQVLEKTLFTASFKWQQEKVREAVCHAAQRTQFRGRWEHLHQEPEIICDIAHNEAGLRYTLDQLLGQYEQGKAQGRYDRLVFIIGMVADKEINRVKDLFPVADYYFTRAQGPRAMDASVLAGHLVEKARRCTVTASVTEALITYFSQASPADLVYIGGSSYVVAEALQFPIFEKKAKN